MRNSRFVLFIFLFVLVLFLTCFPRPALADEPEDEGVMTREFMDVQSDETNHTDTTETEQAPYSRGKVLRILQSAADDPYSEEFGLPSTQLIEVLITKGPHRGEQLQAEYDPHFGLDERYKSVQLSPGDEVLLFLEENEHGSVERAYIAEFARDYYLLYLVLGFVIILIVIGRFKGVKAVLSLGLTILAVFKILLPAILHGQNPIIISVAVCVAVICVTMLIISGLNKKTLAAIIGTTGGVVIAGLIAILIGSLGKFTGFGDEESRMLMYIPQNIHFDFRGLLFSGIIIGAMGATMDVAMSIASAMHEIKTSNPLITAQELIKAGMNVGRDTMATMSNTLILAYAGGSLHLILLLMAYNTPFMQIINWETMASEILRAIAGNIGIIITIPITALTAGLIEARK